jgi:DNA invertase Pin-like site-specific DNA recombinase
MLRKWDIINYDYESKLVGSELLKQNILTDITNNISLKEIAIKYNTSYANVYRIKNKYYDK